MHFLVLVAVLFGAARDEADAIADAARSVREILELRCGECHGSALGRPKGQFGHVTDLVRMAKEPELVVPGDPEASELYLLLVDPEPEFKMPPEGAAFGPMSPAEIAAVRDWIADGALVAAPGGEPTEGADGDAVSGAEGESDPGADAGTDPPAGLSSTDQWLKKVGRFHPLFVHFPLGLLISALIGELLFVVFRSGRLDAAVQFCVVLGAVTGVAAAVAGWFAGQYEGFSGPELTWHRWLGVASGVLALLTALAYPRSARGEGDAGRGRFRLLLLLTAVVISAGGHLGAVLVHGPDFLPIPFPLPFE